MKNCKQKEFCKSYTIVELIIVIGISAILLGIALPSFVGMARGQGVLLGTRNVSAKLKAARSYAIAKRKNIAVMFYAENRWDTMLTRYKPVVVGNVEVGNQKLNFLCDVPGESWSRLPKGIEFDVARVGYSIKDGTVNHKAIIFKPLGSVWAADYLVIKEAGTTTDSDITVVASQMTIHLNEFTGRASYE